ncbi:MAG: glycosyltransferase [uncultured bacterium]|nr:MAG: glycosyltransferase [uncultured bacterium]
MSIRNINEKDIIVCYSNLPTGGASELYKLNIGYLGKKAKVIEITDSKLHPKNIINYLFICLLELPKLHRMLANGFKEKPKVLIGYHSWLTKSPYIFRYLSIPKIYICQELMREYYDSIHIINQNIIERLINFIRLPIKYVDRKNLKSSNLTVVVNSSFSKAMVDKAYHVSSTVIYPGINTALYKVKGLIKKRNQIISVGAISKLKRYNFILHVISKINRSIRPKLVIVGNGADIEYLNSLKKLAIKLEVLLDCKINLSRSLLIKEYLMSKFLIYAPVNEPFGIVVEEAMAARLPLVVYQNGGGYAEILSKENGLIINNLSTKKWANQIEKLLSNQKLLEQYGKYNVSYVNKKYTAKIMNDNLWKTIQSI